MRARRHSFDFSENLKTCYETSAAIFFHIFFQLEIQDISDDFTAERAKTFVISVNDNIAVSCCINKGIEDINF